MPGGDCCKAARWRQNAGGGTGGSHGEDRVTPYPEKAKVGLGKWVMPQSKPTEAEGTVAWQ